ncbi:MAG: hypothetical protein ACJAS1_006645 [Oleiphilaceae bacterium]|jgi:hypothetical protein
MLKKTIITTSLLIAATFSVNAADMKTKIEIKKAEENIEVAKAKLISACGNKSIDFNIDWTNYDSYDYKKLRRTPEQIVRFSGALINKLIEDLSEICSQGEYADMYKSELTKISKVEITGHKDQETRDASFKLDNEGATLVIVLNASSSYDSKYSKLLKALW